NRRQNKFFLQAIGKMNEYILQAVSEVCVSTFEQRGVVGAEFSTDATFSQWFFFLINACSSLRSLKEIQPCSAKYRRIWAILMHKIMFPSESCNSVSKGTFREIRLFSVIAEIFSPLTP